MSNPKLEGDEENPVLEKSKNEVVVDVELFLFKTLQKATIGGLKIGSFKQWKSFRSKACLSKHKNFPIFDIVVHF